MKKLILLLFVFFLAAAPAYAQKSFDMRYNEAVEYYTTKQYDKAIKVLDAAKKSPGVTKDQIAKANRLKSQCQASKQKLADLNLSKESVFAPGIGQVDSIYVTAGKAWEVTSCPSWCETWKEDDVLFIEVLPNKESAPKKGIIEVSMGKERTAYILVSQEKRLDINCPVRVLTRPERAMVYIDSNQGMLSEDFVLGEGKHRIRIEKNGYERKDTTVVIDQKNQDGAVFEFNLKPLFATISVDVKPADGYSFDVDPTLDISGNEVNLHPSIVKRFNVDQDISYYSLYDGNVIPLHPGQYVLRVAAEGFVPEKRSIEAIKGGNQHFEFKLTPVTGTLSVSDEENAAGAVVFVDNKEVGTVPLDDVTLKTGTHKLRLAKPGHMTDYEEYEVVVLEDKNTEFKAVMQRFGEYSLTSEPSYCKIYLDGEYAGTTPLQLRLREGEHKIHLEKNGYYPVDRYVTPAFEGDVQEMHFDLENAYPLLVSCDKDSVDFVISKGSGKSKVVYAEGFKTPSTVQIPLSKTPYHIELLRSDKKLAYKGNFLFSKQSANNLKILTWADGSPFLTADGYIIRPDPYLKSTPLGKDFQRVAGASLSSMRLFPGMTTSLVKGSLFMQTDTDSHITYPATSKNKEDLNYGGAGYSDTMLIPAFSMLLINEEFRVGGALLPFMDVDLLATYAWYPSLTKILPFTHMSGHDVFFGLEVSSRMKVFNVNVKAGMQGLFDGKANICRPGSTSTEGTYHIEPYSQPLQFVITAGFTLGGGTCRGQNILRVF